MGNLVEKFSFVSTSWKIIIPIGNSVGDHIWVIQIQIYNMAQLGGWGGGVVGGRMEGWMGEVVVLWGVGGVVVCWDGWVGVGWLVVGVGCGVVVMGWVGRWWLGLWWWH